MIKITGTFHEKLSYTIFSSAICQRRLAVVPVLRTSRWLTVTCRDMGDGPKKRKITTTFFENEPSELPAMLSVKSQNLCFASRNEAVCPLHCVFFCNILLIFSYETYKFSKIWKGSLITINVICINVICKFLKF